MDSGCWWESRNLAYLRRIYIFTTLNNLTMRSLYRTIYPLINLSIECNLISEFMHALQESAKIKAIVRDVDMGRALRRITNLAETVEKGRNSIFHTLNWTILSFLV